MDAYNSFPPCGGKQDNVEEIAVNTIRLLPNPVKDYLHIESSMPVQMLEITNLHGQVLLQTTMREIDVRNFSIGAYLAHIHFQNGTTKTQLFLKN